MMRRGRMETPPQLGKRGWGLGPRLGNVIVAVLLCQANAGAFPSARAIASAAQPTTLQTGRMAPEVQMGARPELPPGHPPIGAVEQDDQDDDDRESARLPPGHPPTGPEQATDEPADLPPGHPPTGPERPTDEPADLPPGHPPTAPGRRAPGPVEMPAESSVRADATLPPGSIVVEVRDATAQPLPHVPITLELLVQTVAKADNRRRLVAESDESGNARFDHLPVGATISYRAVVVWSGSGGVVATYAAPPFQLELTKGTRARIPVYPATSELSQASIGMQGGVYIQLKDDVLLFDEMFQVYNFGRTTWVAKDVLVDFPAGARALHVELGADGLGFETEGHSARLRGTFSPGRHDVQLRFQIPYAPGETFDVDLPMPPHVMRVRVMAEASKEMKLDVAGFSAAVLEQSPRGQRVLTADRQLRVGEPLLSKLQITLHNLPGPGPERRWITALAAAIVAFGLYKAFRKKQIAPHNATQAEARMRIIEMLRLLDRIHRTGSIGPKTYEHARNELLDALARLLPGS